MRDTVVLRKGVVTQKFNRCEENALLKSGWERIDISGKPPAKEPELKKED